LKSSRKLAILVTVTHFNGRYQAAKADHPASVAIMTSSTGRNQRTAEHCAQIFFTRGMKTARL
jgi:hypothetical protein